MQPLIIEAPSGLPTCKICAWGNAHWLGDHVLEAHDIGIEKYLEMFPGSPTASRELAAKYEGAKKATRKAAAAKSAVVTFGNVEFPVNVGIPLEACLYLPDNYAVPVHGKLAQDVQDVAVALAKSRTIWVHGKPGTGKDAVFSAWSAMTRRPGLFFQVVQGADIQAWKYSRSFDHNGTTWEEGLLLRALRDGYMSSTGTRVPYIIVLSDIDRATRQQMEELRSILDSIQGRITGPDGTVYPVLRGTIIVATANTSGGGDETGRCISANPVDASIMDRFERKVMFHSMDPRDEEPIVRAKFPTLHQKNPKAIPAMMQATKAIRDAVEKGEVFCEWSHRALCAWAGAAEDLLLVLGAKMAEKDLLKRAARAALDGLPNEETRDQVRRIMDSHIPGGAVDEGSTSHIRGTPLK
jgi:MoxR-like ATPase